jgi:hypothetical protein
MLAPIKYPPGIYRNGTKYQAMGRWYDANHIRFYEGSLRPTGGFQQLTQTSPSAGNVSLTGVPRAAIGWRASSNQIYAAFGTNSKLYIFTQGTTADVTPAGFTAGGADAVLSVGAYGSGAYGLGPYGTGDPAQGSLVDAATWQLDTFGEYLVACAPQDGKLYSWQLVLATPAAVLSGAPTGCAGVFVTPERFVVALGAGGDGRLVQWADQESLTSWTPSATNQAGDFPLTGFGKLRAGRRGRGESLLWTDVDLWAMRYIGGPLVYSFERLGTGCGVIAPNAQAMLDGRAVWMSNRGFFLYDGFVKPLSSDVSDYVFSDLNQAQRSKVVCVPNAQFGEVRWYYPSAASMENDRYVVWNYREDHWAIGTLSRTAAFDAGVFDYPMHANAAGAVYEHERGTSHGGATVYAEGGPIELGNGDQVMMVRRIIPDEKTLGDTQAKLYTALYPTATETANGPYTLANPTSVRVSARQVRLRVEEVRPGDWRVGVPRLDVVPGGLR